MDPINSACNLLTETEAKLRILIGEAADARQYEEVAKLAALAKTIEQVLTSFSTGESHANPYPPPASPLGTSPTAPPQAIRGKPQNAEVNGETAKRKSGKQGYPRFERNGDRLVKLGWSKKDKAVYEHRASKDVVAIVSTHLAEVPHGEIFRMDDKLPVELADGSVIPLYQAYLVLAWLRDCGHIDKRGKDGYVWLAENFDVAAFESTWASTAKNR